MGMNTNAMFFTPIGKEVAAIVSPYQKAETTSFMAGPKIRSAIKQQSTVSEFKLARISVELTWPEVSTRPGRQHHAFVAELLSSHRSQRSWQTIRWQCCLTCWQRGHPLGVGERGQLWWGLLELAVPLPSALVERGGVAGSFLSSAEAPEWGSLLALHLVAQMGHSQKDQHHQPPAQRSQDQERLHCG